MHYVFTNGLTWEKIDSLMSLQVQALLVFVVIAAVAAHAAHREARSPGTHKLNL